MLMLKKGVNIIGLKPQMMFAAGMADEIFRYHGIDCEITSAVEGDHNSGSLHASGLALDIHNLSQSPGVHYDIYNKLCTLNEYGFDVVDEKAGQTNKTTAPHFHVEFQPKAGERKLIFC